MNEFEKIKKHSENIDSEMLSRKRVRSSDDDHQMEFVDEVNGVAFINDSKSMDHPVFWTPPRAF